MNFQSAGLFGTVTIWTDAVAPFTATLLLNSTCIISLGLFVKFLLGKKGAAAQSVVLKTTLIAVLVSAAAGPFLRDVAPVRFRIVEYETQSADTDAHAVVGRTISHSAAYDPVIPTKKLSPAPVTRKSPVRSENLTLPLPAVSNENPAAESHLSSPDTSGPQSGTHKTGETGQNRSYTTVRTIGLTRPVHTLFNTVFPIIWLVCSLYLFVKTLTGMLYIRHLKARSIPAPLKTQALCRQLSDMLGTNCPDVLEHPKVDRAVMFGILRPFILLPPHTRDASHGGYDVLIHELAHLRERDNLWNHLYQLSKIIIPFQPLLWTLSYKFVELSDYICDDYVIQFSKNRMNYASRLVSLALALRGDDNMLPEGAGIISFKSQLRRRIERIVDFSYIPDVTIRESHLVTVSLLLLTGILVTGFMSIAGVARESDMNTNVPAFAENDDSDDMNGEHDAPGRPDEMHMPVIMKMSNRLKESTNYYGGAAAERPNLISPENRMRNDSHEESDEFAQPLEAVFGRLPTATMNDDDYKAPVMSDSERREVYPSDTAVAGYQTVEKAEYEYTLDLNASDIMTEGLNDIAGMGFGTERTAVNASSGGNSSPHLAKLEIVIPDEYEYGDISDPKRRKMSDFYRSLRKNKKYPVWSPDGEKIAFNDSDYGVWIVNADGGEPFLVYDNYYKLIYQSHNLHYGELQTIGFSPDGDEIAFRRYGIDTNRGTKVIIDDKGEVAVYYIENPLPVIESVNIKTGESRILAEGGLTGSWSHSGRFFAYISTDMESRRELWLLDIKSGSRRQLDSSDPVNVRFTPGDSAVIVSEKAADSPEHIVCIDIDSGGRNELLVTEHASFSDISPDGGRLLCTDTTSGSQFLYNTVTGVIDDIPRPDATFESLTVWSRFSPDGSKLCLNCTETTGKETAWSIYIRDVGIEKAAAAENEQSQPVPFSIRGNFPNPFNMSTAIEFSIAKGGHATLDIYNNIGQKVRELVYEHMEPGIHRMTWDGCDDNGGKVSTGMYVASLTVEDRMLTHKMMVMK